MFKRNQKQLVCFIVTKFALESRSIERLFRLKKANEASEYARIIVVITLGRIVLLMLLPEADTMWKLKCVEH